MQEYHRNDGGFFPLHPIRWHTISICPITNDLYFHPLVKSGIFWAFPLMKLIFFLLINEYFAGDTLKLCQYPVLYETYNFFSYFSQCEVLASYFIKWDIICYCHLFWCSNHPKFHLSPFSLPPVFFGHVLIILWTLPLISGTRCSKLIMFFACPSPEISHFSKDPWFFLVGNGMKARVWALGVSVAIGVLLLPGPLKRHAHICICIYVTMYRYMYKYRHVCKYSYMYIQVYTNLFLYITWWKYIYL